ncbi:hypothetical protein VYU27_000159 [Nannochloropsis oceanica]
MAHFTDLPLLVPFPPFPRTPLHQQRVLIQLPPSTGSSLFSPIVICIYLPESTSKTRVGEVKGALFQALALAPAVTTTTTSVPESQSNESWCNLTLGKAPTFHPTAKQSDVQPLLTRGPNCYVLLPAELQGQGSITFLDDNDLVSVAPREWCLMPANELPPARFLVRITSTRRKMDAFGKEYVAYDITVKNGLLAWQLCKRYSDFAVMHERLNKHEQQQRQQLQQQGEETILLPLPHLPSKLFQAVQGRKERLEVYLQQVVDRPFSKENPHVLAFLGILSSMSAKLYSIHTDISNTTNNTSRKKRQILHISALGKTLQMGDIVLFQCAHNMAGLQRNVTRSEWDHALVVKRQDGREFDLLESTADGVTCWPLSSRISAYATEFTSYMGIRKLEGERTPAMQKRLHAFVEQVKGKPYGFPLGALFASKYVAPTQAIASPVGAGPISEGDSSSSISSSSFPCSFSSFLSLNDFRGRWRELGTAAVNELFKLGLRSKGERDKQEVAPAVTKAAPAVTKAAPAASPPRQVKNAAEEEAPGSFFCSNLVAAALREMGVLKAERNINYFLPGAFTAGGEVDEAVRAGWRFGDVILLDVSALEMGKASMVEDG